MTNQRLDSFGELLIRKVRDEAIEDWDTIIDGRMKGAGPENVRAALSTFGAEQIDVLRWLVPQIVDTTLHHLLWALEQDRSVDVAVRARDGIIPSIREESDGLAGELYGRRGWIARFTTQRHEELRP